MILEHELAWVDEKIYWEIYESSLKYPNEFWMRHMQDISWKKSPMVAFDERSGRWLPGGISNVCYNCIDRHAEKTPDKPAIVWYGDMPGERREISFAELQRMVVRISSVLRARGVKKGNVVGVYMPMIPEAIAAMQACARMGALHLVVFAGFSAEALAYRLSVSQAKVILTVSAANRGGKRIRVLDNVEAAVVNMERPPEIINVDTLGNVELDDRIEWLSESDNLFVLYTSGSSGKPKGIIHSALPYILYVATTFKVIFDIKPNDVYFCTSDVGWITGHSYIAYAPLFFGLTTVIFSGSPTYPEADRYWDIIEREHVSIFYSAPTAIRSLQMFNQRFVEKHDLSSLRMLGSVGEPINRSAWQWYFDVVGGGRCPIMDTWWQTETGGIVLAPLRTLKQKPGVAGKPFFGISPKISDNGELTITSKWAGLCRAVVYECGVVGNTPEFCENIFKKNYFKDGAFLTGDGATQDANGDIKISGRLDDVINISGHRLGTAEFECAINKIDEVKESAVVAVPHDIKGQTAFAYVVSKTEPLTPEAKADIAKKIISATRCGIGAIAKPDFIAFVPDLPKTRSGKIVRHILRAIANDESYEGKDMASIVNPGVLSDLQTAVQNSLHCPDMCKLK